MDSKKMLEIAVKAADSKRAEDIIALNMQEVSLLADYFVIMTGNSQRQVAAIADAIIEKEEAAGVTVGHVEGKKDSPWVLLDFNDIVIHIFLKEEREFYNLEKLWNQAPEVDVTDWLGEKAEEE
ncbi:hypothetical protein IV38_GL000618 [Lactobacillus selangorensis]|uniref:Ribosomal silencing factor RsfS n=1 Tax=Lactobacillus selangorensis TaxID=81857 RepID=A0A0R2GAJ0_9LACO|nr:ribosome silencing factor [Lactobacillus selangorensis]KRN29730.1 hypothetical protein IV38_GL000618 [Lactobacillus selangorensis]KRN33741.1 hypothetical protein IV40_GL000049 [Lactobacillus selangorensis]